MKPLPYESRTTLSKSEVVARRRRTLRHLLLLFGMLAIVAGVVGFGATLIQMPRDGPVAKFWDRILYLWVGAFVVGLHLLTLFGVLSIRQKERLPRE